MRSYTNKDFSDVTSSLKFILISVLQSRMYAARYFQNLRTVYLAPSTVPAFCSSVQFLKRITPMFYPSVQYIIYVFLCTAPSINLVKQRSTNDICNLCWCVFCLYLISIIPKDKLKAAFLKRVNGSTQDELIFVRVNQFKGVNQKNGNW